MKDERRGVSGVANGGHEVDLCMKRRWVVGDERWGTMYQCDPTTIPKGNAHGGGETPRIGLAKPPDVAGGQYCYSHEDRDGAYGESREWSTKSKSRNNSGRRCRPVHPPSFRHGVRRSPHITGLSGPFSFPHVASRQLPAAVVVNHLWCS